jgi:hypothetical protein
MRINSRNMIWARNAARMGEIRNAHKILVVKLEGNNPKT